MLNQVLISLGAQVCVSVCECVRIMVDLEKCTKGLKDVLCGGLLLLDCWLGIELHAWTRAQHQPLEHIELAFKIHTHIKTPVFIELWSYSR